MIKVDTQQALTDFKGEIVKNGTENIVCGTIFANILGGITQNPSLAWQLGKKFATQKEVELKAEDVVFLKAEINSVATKEKAWLSSMMAGQLIEILENGKTENK